MTQHLWTALSEVQDPEMPINLVDLGVIYDVRERLLREPGVNEVRVNVVWDPPWTSARMTQEGRDALETWGLAV